MRRGLPLIVWAAAFAVGSVLASVGTAALVLSHESELDRVAEAALGLGAAVGLLLGGGTVAAAQRVSAALRGLHDDAVRRLRDPSTSLPLDDSRPVASSAARELSALAAVLEALQVRVRLGDLVAERHREQAETAGAGVFELLSGLVAAEEGTRGQLAAELHDTVAQSLMIARRLLAEGPTTPAQLSILSDHVEDAEEQVRAVMARTRPPALREGDLALAVDNLRLDMHARYGLEVGVHWPRSPHPLPLASAITVYRFFQEALLNVIKHADVEEASVVLFVDERLVRASVSDSGPGFDPKAVRPEGGRQVGLGLLGERARLSGGSLEITSVPGAGTTLTLELPRPPGAAPVPPQREPSGRPELMARVPSGPLDRELVDR